MPTPYAFFVHAPSRVWTLCAESAKSQSDWLAVIRAAIPFRGSMAEARHPSNDGSDSEWDVASTVSPLPPGESDGISLAGSLPALTLLSQREEEGEAARPALPPVRSSSVPSVMPAAQSLLSTALMTGEETIAPAEGFAEVLATVPKRPPFPPPKPSVGPPPGVVPLSPSTPYKPSVALPVGTLPLSPILPPVSTSLPEAAPPAALTAGAEGHRGGRAATEGDDDFADVEASCEGGHPQTEEEIEEAAARAVASMTIGFPFEGSPPGTDRGNVLVMLAEERRRREKEAKEAEERRLAAMTPEEREAFLKKQAEEAALEKRKSRRSMVQLGAYGRSDTTQHRTRGGKRK